MQEGGPRTVDISYQMSQVEQKQEAARCCASQTGDSRHEFKHCRGSRHGKNIIRHRKCVMSSAVKHRLCHSVVPSCSGKNLCLMIPFRKPKPTSSSALVWLQFSILQEKDTAVLSPSLHDCLSLLWPDDRPHENTSFFCRCSYRIFKYGLLVLFPFWYSMLIIRSYSV